MANTQRKIDLECEDINSIAYGTEGAYLKALGYLSAWGFGSNQYIQADIHINIKDYTISARYSNPHQPNWKPFVLVGIWDSRTKTYSFHS